MGGRHANHLEEISRDPAVLDDGRFWAVAVSFEGEMTFARFSHVTDSEFPNAHWENVKSKWKSTNDESAYRQYVESVRSEIADGSVYQVNACYELSAELPEKDTSLRGLFSKLLHENPAPFAQYLSIPGLEIASASPERLLSVSGRQVLTSPIKGTIRENESGFGEKDKAENLMIVDLMRNDLGRICKDGSVEVSDLFRSEKHPGLTHLVSDVRGELRADVAWKEILLAICPAGSVSGAPKSAALKTISKNEMRARGIYCGALGWVHGDKAEIAVGIRTFWKGDDGILRFGTGAGITWGSDPLSEWKETQLKARRLISIAGGDL
jgi:para-aminobenzoate synthetase component 1